MKVWTKVQVVLDKVPVDWSLYTEVFERFGISNTEQKDNLPALEGYLSEKKSTSSILDSLKESFLKNGAKEVIFTSVPEEDWAESWKQFFHAKEVGNHFMICPSWDVADASADRRLIVLDPGQVFGTGEHPTTRMCLELMETIPVEGRSVIDVGCGSGILSIAAALLGAKSVVGVDVEPESVEATKENAARNQVSVAVHEGKGFDPITKDQNFDVVVSNIISPVILLLIPEVKSSLRTGGYWLVSGIIEANWPNVFSALTDAGFKCMAQKQEGEWIAATFQH